MIANTLSYLAEDLVVKQLGGCAAVIRGGPSTCAMLSTLRVPLTDTSREGGKDIPAEQSVLASRPNHPESPRLCGTKLGIRPLP